MILKENYLVVFDTINYRWTQIFEGFNHSPRIFKKVRGIDVEEIKLKILYNEGINNKYTFELENAIENNLVKKFWVSCQG